jgi:predicted unusual protein kinase regulating ubiquinone biosynthesis (AarF/ABC1/UbiB family)
MWPVASGGAENGGDHERSAPPCCHPHGETGRAAVGLAGRTALGTGKRPVGRPAELVAREIQQRTTDQVFRVLGELKGGAMKLGQALSVFEAALPSEIAGPYRVWALTLLLRACAHVIAQPGLRLV